MECAHLAQLTRLSWGGDVGGGRVSEWKLMAEEEVMDLCRHLGGEPSWLTAADGSGSQEQVIGGKCRWVDMPHGS